MNNNTNTTGQNTQTNPRSFQKQEAERRAALATPQETSLGLNATINDLGLGTTGYPNNYTNLSSLNDVPNLNNTLSVDYSEIKQAKRKTNESSTTSYRA